MEKHSIVLPQEGLDELYSKTDFVVAGQGAGTLNSYPDFVRNLFKLMGDPVRDMMHACAGIAGEGGEILDIAKKVWVYGKQLDSRNLVEELGDLRFYYQAALNLLEVTDEVVRQRAVNRRVIALTGTPADTLLRACSNLNVHAAKALDVAVEGWDLRTEPDAFEVGCMTDNMLDALCATRSYYSYLLEMMDISDLNVQAHNMFKLSLNPDARFPGGVYTDAAAIARADKVAEGETASSGVAGE